MSKWQEEKAERNRRSSRASPRHYRPSSHRLFCRGRSAARSCRRRHGSRLIPIGAPIRFAPIGWRARLLPGAGRLAAGVGGSAITRERTTSHIPNPTSALSRTQLRAWSRICCVCGRPVYRFGWHIDLWDTGPNKNAVWHCACVIAWQFWNAPSSQARLLRRLQARRCGETGGRLWKSAEVDHRVPLFRVWNEYRDAPWAKLLDYWGLPNLQMINRHVHAAKCATEARAIKSKNSEATEVIFPGEPFVSDEVAARQSKMKTIAK